MADGQRRLFGDVQVLPGGDGPGLGCPAYPPAEKREELTAGIIPRGSTKDNRVWWHLQAPGVYGAAVQHRPTPKRGTFPLS